MTQMETVWQAKRRAEALASTLAAFYEEASREDREELSTTEKESVRQQAADLTLAMGDILK